ncbi:DUF4124 domain-containing protein [Stenotrophomonas sp. ZAC14D1_NAIMI4_6]|uniref:DUF4124 domain-containing protein n=1 Tax=Stenotrophomonas TaxID=40323 RepID=UPI0009A19C9F|nr:MULTISPECIES: DUF4124 domain-containing protein [Stenotrophomonas]AWH39164.1 DUF4124 domain-containing protein [Stenotrophomonas sp. ZAC14D1_NAIMI4_6]AWH43300.1 DUF4124 domain-containing protein [Stenotrophomonas sp. ZAC14D1_NAIMI4_1]MDI9272817.1 DUF4124 domain-containing protein [Stenotrophomonas sp. PFBMAA-4]
MRALSCLGCLLLLASANAVAGPVYKWKDAKGVTQYSETPPAGAKYETREQARGTQPAAPAAAEAAPVPEQCSTARANVTLLAGTGPVMQDTDGDGKADTALTPEQRSAQKGLAEAAIKAYCPPEG